MRLPALAVILLATVTASPAVAAYASPPPPIAVVRGECSDYYDTVAYVRAVGSVCMYNAPIEAPHS